MATTALTAAASKAVVSAAQADALVEQGMYIRVPSGVSLLHCQTLVSQRVPLFPPFTIKSIYIHSAMTRVERAIKQEFEEAREIVPELVAAETQFIDFLRCESMDPYKAAVRVAMYWKGRKILFSERWLLPMNQVSCRFCCCSNRTNSLSCSIFTHDIKIII